MKSNSDTNWERQVELAKAEISQQEEQRANARKFLSLDVSALQEVGKQFVFICLLLVVLYPVLLNPYLILMSVVLIPHVLLAALWMYYLFNPV